MNKPLIIIKAILDGIEVKFPDSFTYVLAEDSYGKTEMAVKATKLTKNGEEKTLLMTDYVTFGYVVDQAEKMSDEDVIAIAGGNALREVYNKNR